MTSFGPLSDLTNSVTSIWGVNPGHFEESGSYTIHSTFWVLLVFPSVLTLILPNQTASGPGREYLAPLADDDREALLNECCLYDMYEHHQKYLEKKPPYNLKPHNAVTKPKKQGRKSKACQRGMEETKTFCWDPFWANEIISSHETMMKRNHTHQLSKQWKRW